VWPEEQGYKPCGGCSCLTWIWCPGPRGGDPARSWGTELGPSAARGAGQECTCLTRSWCPVGPEGQGAQGLGIPTEHGSGAELVPRVAQGTGILVGHEFSTELGPGADQRVESPAEQSSHSAGLWGRDLAGQLFF
jgi:hypothetical protein